MEFIMSTNFVLNLAAIVVVAGVSLFDSPLEKASDVFNALNIQAEHAR
jgi:hypothetical protein